MSSTDQDPTRDAVRRKFDEVASLFGSIVPPAGSPVRPRVLLAPSALPQASESELDRQRGPQLVSPPQLLAPPAETLQSMPPAEPRAANPALTIATPTVVPIAPLRPDPLPDRVIPKGDHATPAQPDKRSEMPAEPVTRVRRKGAPSPWPDAFVPRPNYRRSRKSNFLYWLFLIPFAIVVAVAITLVDPRAIRTFVEESLPQYLPAGIAHYIARPATGPTTLAPLLPEPLSPAPSPVRPVAPPGDAQPAVPLTPIQRSPETRPVPPPPAIEPSPAPDPSTQPQSTSPPAPANANGPPPASTLPEAPPPPVAPASETEATTPAPVSAPRSELPTPAAVLVSPSIGPPAATNDSNESTPSPPLPPSAAIAAGPARVTIYYRRNEAGGEGEARRVATKIGNAEIHASQSTARSPTIYYFNAADREAATAIARTLAGEGPTSWIVRAGPIRQIAGAIDIWLP